MHIDNYRATRKALVRDCRDVRQNHANIVDPAGLLEFLQQRMVSYRKRFYNPAR